MTLTLNRQTDMISLSKTGAHLMCTRKGFRIMKELNTPTINDEKANINRAAIEHRATWMGLIYDELKKDGIDPEPAFRRAIKRCGLIHGANFKAACENPDDCRDFAKVFFGDLGRKTFEQDVHETTETETSVDFHYCALLAAWKKLGFDDETCAKLCDIAMDGDRGIAEAMGLTLDLTDTIAKGCPTCKLCFHK